MDRNFPWSRGFRGSRPWTDKHGTGCRFIRQGTSFDANGTNGSQARPLPRAGCNRWRAGPSIQRSRLGFAAEHTIAKAGPTAALVAIDLTLLYGVIQEGRAALNGKCH